jgi:hypothetical protein
MSVDNGPAVNGQAKRENKTDTVLSYLHPPSSPLLAAAAMIKAVLDAADKEKGQLPCFHEEEGKATHNGNESVAEILPGEEHGPRADHLMKRSAAVSAAVAATAATAAAAEGAKNTVATLITKGTEASSSALAKRESSQLQYQPRDREKLLYEHQHEEQLLRHLNFISTNRLAAAVPIQPRQALASQNPPSRAPGRSFRKRQRPISTSGGSPESLPSSEKLLRLAAAGQRVPQNIEDIDVLGNATAAGRAIGACRNAMPRSPQKSRPLLHSTIRLISSETYLRRLFVTSSLARVLSLDACLPRYIPPTRKASFRAAWSGNKGAAKGGDGSTFEIAAGRHDEAAPPDSSYREGIDDEISEKRQPVAAAQKAIFHGSEPFQKLFPVTLIDSANQRWNITYIATSRENLLSGRLVDGWDAFCRANGLRIGDMVEFTRVEDPNHGQQGGKQRRCTEAIARVCVHKKER